MKPTKPKINPGKGWRLLRGNEIVKEGDEFYGAYSERWKPATPSFGKRTVRDRIGNPIMAYRRKVKTTRK